MIASADGAKLYVTIGSNSNVGENGIAAEEGRADIWEVDPKTGTHRVFASGLRNPTAWAGAAAPSGPRSTSATRSAAIWCPTT